MDYKFFHRNHTETSVSPNSLTQKKVGYFVFLLN